MTDDYDAVGFVVASDYRVAVLEELARGPGVPSKLAERTGFAIAHVSRTLGKLRDRGLVELLVPESRKKGRIYGITEAGESVHERVREMQEVSA